MTSEEPQTRLTAVVKRECYMLIPNIDP